MPLSVCRLLLLLLCWLVPCASAQEFDDSLMDDINVTQKYVLQMSGNVLNERFTGAQAALLLSKAPPGSLHKYLVIVEGFPRQQTRNSFYWNSEESAMESQLSDNRQAADAT